MSIRTKCLVLSVVARPWLGVGRMTVYAVGSFSFDTYLKTGNHAY